MYRLARFKTLGSTRPWLFDGMPILYGKGRQGGTFDRAEWFK